MASPADAPETEARTPAAPWLALLAGPMSFGIASPSLILPVAAEALAVPVGAATGIVTAFGLGIAVGTPLMAGLLRHRGTRAALLGSTLLLLIGSVLTLTTPVLPVLIAAGLVQGLGSAGMVTTAMNLARSAFVMGLVTASLAVFGATAPLVGSLVADALSWRVTLALAGVSLLAVPACLRDARSAPTAHDRFDGRGAVLLTALVTALVLVPHFPLGAVAGVVVAGALFVPHLRARPDGFLPVVLVRTPRFLVSSLLAFALAVVNFGIFYWVPIQLFARTDWTASEIGIAMLWPLLFGGAATWAVVTATARLRFTAVVVGFVAAGITAAVLAFAATAPLVLLVAPAVSSIASGQGVFAYRATAAVPDGERPAAIGFFNLCYLLGAAFGPAIVALLAG